MQGGGEVREGTSMFMFIMTSRRQARRLQNLQQADQYHMQVLHEPDYAQAAKQPIGTLLLLVRRLMRLTSRVLHDVHWPGLL